MHVIYELTVFFSRKMKTIKDGECLRDGPVGGLDGCIFNILLTLIFF